MDMRVMIPSTFSKQTDAFIIKNPGKTTNTFTFTEESKAADELRMWQQRELSDLKQFLKGAVAGAECNTVIELKPEHHAALPWSFA